MIYLEYTKQNFYTGQKLLASHLNHIEDGIANIRIDASLTNADQAADAKTVGDTINKLTTKIDKNTENVNKNTKSVTSLNQAVSQLKEDLSKLSESKMPIVFSEIANIEITESGVSLISLQSGDHYIQEKYTTFFLKMITPANSDATADMVPMLYFSINNKIDYDDYGYYNIFGCSNGAFSIQREYKVSSMIQFVIVGNSVSSVAMKNGYNAPSYGFTTISSVGGNLNGRGRADITGVILKIRNNGEYPSFPIGTKISLYAR